MEATKVPLLRKSSRATAALTEDESISIEELNNQDPAFVSRDTGANEATKFVYEQGHEWHPIFPCPALQVHQRDGSKSPLSYDGQRAAVTQIRSARLEKCGPLDRQADHFAEVAELFQQSSKGKQLPSGFDIRGKHTLDEVMKVADAAEARVNAEGSKNIFRRTGRKIQSNALAMTHIMELMPGGDYTSVLCGGLKIAFDVAHQLKERRDTILELFRRLPSAIEMAGERLQEHPDDERLFDMVTRLYIVVLESIETMIKWLVDKSTWRKIGSLLKQPLSAKSIDTGLVDVEQQMEVVLNRAQTLHNKMFGQVHTSVREIETKAERMEVTAQNTERIVNSLQQNLSTTPLQVQAIGGMIAVLTGKLLQSEWLRKRDAWDMARQREHDVRRITREMRDIKRGLEISTSDAESTTRTRPSRLDQVHTSRSALSQAFLENMLGVDLEVIVYDKRMVTIEGAKDKPSSQARAHWLLSNPRFEHWLTAEEPQGLLVDGRGDGSKKISPMSYLCALLSLSLQHTEPVVSFTFFCGLHVAEMDPIRGPSGLVRSLVRQLLDVQHFHLEFIDLDFEEQLRQYDIGSLLDLFYSLFEQLPGDLVLFCVIDGVSFYESAGQIDDLENVISFLADLTKRRDTGPVFKLLLTTPRLHRSAIPYFSQHDRIAVPDNADHGRFLTAPQAITHAAMIEDTRGKSIQEVVEGTGESDEEGDYDLGNFSASED
ncbi:MAG: hypothetical protein Q9172_001609 [Xanthocarpia lactea]